MSTATTLARAARSRENRLVRLQVRYHRASELVADHASQLSHGGLLVRVEAPSLDRFVKLPLALALGDDEVSLDAEVVQTFPGVGVAVTFAPSAALDALVETARARDDDGEASAEHRFDDGSERSTPSHRPAWVNPAAVKVNAALKGTREDRIAILRENLPQLHLFVLKNPGLQLDEVASIAKMRTVTAEVLKQIADRREWAQRPEIACALVRNPKTPLGIAIRMLDFVSPGELRQLAKDNGVRQPIQSAARKKVVA